MNVAQLALLSLADWCVVDLVEEDKPVRRAAVAHVNPAKEALIHEFQRYPPQLNSENAVAKVIRSGRPEIFPEVSDGVLETFVSEAEHLRILCALGAKSLMVVPLIAQNRTLGTITFAAAESGRRYRSSDLNLATELADHAAFAINNARLHSEVQEMNLRKDEFLAMLAHELRNPLAPISNILKLLQLQGAGDPDLRRSLDVLGRQVQHIIRLVDDLLDISRITRRKMALQKVLLELSTVVTHAIETSRPFIEARKHQLSVSLPEEPVQLVADPVRLGQIIVNLLNNAAKYTEPGGHIWLTCMREGSEVVIRVKDTGIGISPDMLTRVFDMFTQMGQSSSRSQGGLGIGLTLVRSLVILHGGSISAHSAGLGQGSEFVVRLPAFTEASPAPSPVATKEEGTSGRHLRILVVDDNVDAATTLAELLSLLGYEVQVVHDGPAAVELASAYQPDVVLLDIRLPGMDGYLVAQKLRQNLRLSKTIIAALTGYGREGDPSRFQEAGFDYHFIKPLDINVLERVLKNKINEKGKS